MRRGGLAVAAALLLLRRQTCMRAAVALLPSAPAAPATQLRCCSSNNNNSSNAYARDASPLDVVSHVVASSTSSSSTASSDVNTTTTTTSEQEQPSHVTTTSSSSRHQRRKRRKHTVDDILHDVLNDALRMRDRGEQATPEFVYQRTQERMYATSRGRKGTGAKEAVLKNLPYPPSFTLQRLLPLWADVATSTTTSKTSTSNNTSKSNSDTKTPCAARETVRSKNDIHTYSLMDEDPWPQRAITPDNPVWTESDVAADERATGGTGLREHEARLYAPRPGSSAVGEFADAADELAYWEDKLLRFVREVPLWQRRTLPYLHEWYRMLVHRIVRAERRYTTARDAALTAAKASSAVYARSEDALVRVRGIYAEVHRSLASVNYDPLQMRRSVLAPLLHMSSDEYDTWRAQQRQQLNALLAELD